MGSGSWIVYTLWVVAVDHVLSRAEQICAYAGSCFAASGAPQGPSSLGSPSRLHDLGGQASQFCGKFWFGFLTLGLGPRRCEHKRPNQARGVPYNMLHVHCTANLCHLLECSCDLSHLARGVQQGVGMEAGYPHYRLNRMVDGLVFWVLDWDFGILDWYSGVLDWDCLLNPAGCCCRNKTLSRAPPHVPQV